MGDIADDLKDRIWDDNSPFPRRKKNTTPKTEPKRKNHNMNLIKPICFFDIESSGTDVNKDRIVQIAGTKYNPDGTEETKNVLINPTIPIPKEASDVHGISDEDVKDKPTFQQLSKGIFDWFKGCDIGGFNSDSFDCNILAAEFERAGIKGFPEEGTNFVDAMKLYRILFPNTLGAIYKRLFKKDFDNAHSADADVSATKEVFDYLIKNGKKLCPEDREWPKEITPESIDKFCQADKRRVDLAGKLYEDEDGVIRYAFGKDVDKSVKENPGFGNWMLGVDFPQQTKDIVKKLISK